MIFPEIAQELLPEMPATVHTTSGSSISTEMASSELMAGAWSPFPQTEYRLSHYDRPFKHLVPQLKGFISHTWPRRCQSREKTCFLCTFLHRKRSLMVVAPVPNNALSLACCEGCTRIRKCCHSCLGGITLNMDWKEIRFYRGVIDWCK